MRTRFFVVIMSLLLGANAACGAGAKPSPPPSAADYKDAEALNPRLEDGRTVHLGFDTHHPECFVFASKGSAEETEEIECPDAAAVRLKDCPGGVVYRARSQSGCVCVHLGDEDPRHIECPL